MGDGVVVSDMIDMARARASFYRMLGGLYLNELSEEDIERLSQGSFASADLGNAEANEGLSDMAAYLRRAPRNVRQELAVDFAGSILAAGVYEERRATPYESVFTSATGLLMQEARDDVYRYYCESGVEVDESPRMPEDHFSFECEFMALLADRSADKLAEGDTAGCLDDVNLQASFYADHLANWVDSLCACLEGCARTRFYRGVAKLTRGFVAEDGQLIEEMKGELEGMLS